MSFFSIIKSFIKQDPKEQIVGYSISELKSIFVEPLLRTRHALLHQPSAASLEDIGVPAYYASLLIDRDDIQRFLSLVESSLIFVIERNFNGLPTRRYQRVKRNENLILYTSTREFNSITIQMVANSIDFLEAIRREKFAVPPPWIAFEGYNPTWWGESMQGAQGYYNENYFLPFFTSLSDAERRAYYVRYNALDEWINSLELMCLE